MPSFASALETTLHKALEAASSRRHEYATLEHLLLALIDDEHASKVMQSCGVDTAELTKTPAALHASRPPAKSSIMSKAGLLRSFKDNIPVMTPTMVSPMQTGTKTAARVNPSG